MGMGFMIKGGDVSIGGILTGLAGTACVFGVSVGIAFAILAAAGNGLSEEKTASWSDFAVNGSNATNATFGSLRGSATTPAEELPTGLPVWLQVLIWSGILIGCDVFCLLLMICMVCLYRRR